MGGFVDKFILNMNPIITNMDQVLFEKRDSCINQATQLMNLMKDLGIQNSTDYKNAITEILTQAFPKTGAEVNTWDVEVSNDNNAAGGGMGGL